MALGLNVPATLFDLEVTKGKTQKVLPEWIGHLLGGVAKPSGL